MCSKISKRIVKGDEVTVVSDIVVLSYLLSDAVFRAEMYMTYVFEVIWSGYLCPGEHSSQIERTLSLLVATHLCCLRRTSVGCDSPLLVTNRIKVDPSVSAS
jgi:hypothetical protein